MKNANNTQLAAKYIEIALQHLNEAKHLLLRAKSDQRIHLCLNVGALEEIHATLLDPECTPEIVEGFGELEYVPVHDESEWDSCIWDSERIEATKTILFHEHLEARN